MTEAERYLIRVADRGDLSKFLKSCDRNKPYVYRGAYSLDLYIKGNKIVGFAHDERDLKPIDI
jgi:hypothetical protein